MLSAAITTKAGKTLLARQFVEMSRIRIEGLLLVEVHAVYLLAQRCECPKVCWLPSPSSSAPASSTRSSRRRLSDTFIRFAAVCQACVCDRLCVLPRRSCQSRVQLRVASRRGRFARLLQPIENMYLLLITNKSSNIMEDLDTLRILAKIVPEFCPTLEEEHVQVSRPP